MKPLFENLFCHFPNGTGCELCIAYECSEFKYFSLCRDFKAARLLAIGETLTIQAASSPSSRVKRDTLLLTAACVWLLNGQHERPDYGPSWRSLLETVLPTVKDKPKLPFSKYEPDLQDDNELYTSTLYYPYGVVFLRRVHLGHGDSAPRMKKGGPFLPPTAIKDLFGENEEEICQRYLVSENLSENLLQS